MQFDRLFQRCQGNLFAFSLASNVHIKALSYVDIPLFPNRCAELLHGLMLSQVRYTRLPHLECAIESRIIGQSPVSQRPREQARGSRKVHASKASSPEGMRHSESGQWGFLGGDLSVASDWNVGPIFPGSFALRLRPGLISGHPGFPGLFRGGWFRKDGTLRIRFLMAPRAATAHIYIRFCSKDLDFARRTH